jgi:septum formation protein
LLTRYRREAALTCEKTQPASCHNQHMLILASASPRRSELLTQAGFSFTVHPAHIPEDPYPDEDPIAYVTRLAREKAQAVYREMLGAPGLDSEAGDSTDPLAPPGAPSFSRSLRKGCETTNECASDQLGAPGLDSEAGDSTDPQAPPGAPSFSRSLRNAWETTEANASDQRASAPPQVVLGADTTVTLDIQILGKPESPADAARMLRLLSGRTHRVITGIALVTAEQTRTAAEVTTVQFLPISDQEIAAYIATGEPMDKAGAYAIQGRAARWIPRIEGCYFNVVGLPISLVTSLLNSSKPQID